MNIENDSSDDEWVDNEEDIKVERKLYNTKSLPNFSRECDQYKLTDREGAKLGNAMLKDLVL